MLAYGQYMGSVISWLYVISNSKCTELGGVKFKLCRTLETELKLQIFALIWMSLRSEAQSIIFSEEGTQNTFARTHPQRHSSNVMAYLPPETSKITTSGIKTLPEDLHLGANMTGNTVQCSPPFERNFYTYFGFLFFSFSPVQSITAKQYCCSTEPIPRHILQVLLQLFQKEPEDDMSFVQDHTEKPI